MKEFGLTNKEEVFLLTSVGNQKTGFSQRDYNPVEVGEKIDKALSNGASQQDIANFLEVHQALIGRFLRVFTQLDSSFHHLVSFTPVPDGFISFDHAQEIARFKKSQQSQIIKAILENKFTRLQIQAVFQQYERSDQKLSQIIKTIAKRTGGKRRLLMMGSIPDDLNEKMEKYKLKDLEKLGKTVLKNSKLQTLLKKENIKAEKLKFGKNTFSLLIFRNSISRQLIESISKTIINGLKNEIK